MKKYSKYKRVDLPWIKDIPENWTFQRIGNIFEQRREKNNPIKTKEILSLSAKYGVTLYSERKEKGGNKPKDDLTKYNVCHQGDILLNSMNVVSGAVGISPYFGAISPVYYALMVLNNNISVNYMDYLMRNYDFQRSLVGLGKGIQMSETEDGKLFTVRMRISWDVLKTQNLVIPPLEEQEHIVKFLDWKINEIDQLIQKELRIIDELTKYQKSIIMKEILNFPSNSFVNSGLYWADRIPENWRIVKLKRVLKKVEIDAQEEREVVICSNHGYSFLRGDKKLGLYSDDNNMYQNVERGQIMIHGMDTWHGAICISEHGGKCTRVVHVCETNESKQYIVFYLRLLSFLGMYKPYSNGVRQNTSDFRSWDKLGNIDIILPPLEIQNEITEKLESKIKVAKETISKINTIIEELYSLKQSLISEIVTGCIDVRNISIPFYEKVEIFDTDLEVGENEEE